MTASRIWEMRLDWRSLNENHAAHYLGSVGQYGTDVTRAGGDQCRSPNTAKRRQESTGANAPAKCAGIVADRREFQTELVRQRGGRTPDAHRMATIGQPSWEGPRNRGGEKVSG